MKIYPANATEIIEADAPQDPNAELFYGFKFKPEIWKANTVYDKQKNYIVPPSPNGFLYLINSNGISGATAPDFGTVKNELTIDGSVELKAVEYNAFLDDSETLSDSTWEVTNGVTMANDSYTAGGDTMAKFGPIPDGVTEFTITNHVTKSNGEKDDRSMIINVSER